MIIIKNIEDIKALKDNSTIPHLMHKYIEGYFSDVWKNLTSEFNMPIEEFDLGDGYIIILDAKDEVRALEDLSILGSGNLLDLFPEYVEIPKLSDDTLLYEIFILCDNECGITLFSILGQFDAEVEQWLMNQTGLV